MSAPEEVAFVGFALARASRCRLARVIMSRAFGAIVTIITALEGPDCHDSRSAGGAPEADGRICLADNAAVAAWRQAVARPGTKDGSSRITQGKEL